MRKWIRKLSNASGQRPCEICNTVMFLEEHHIRGRDIPDFDMAYNKCNLCPNCHRKVHKKCIIIEDWRVTSNGKELIWHSVGEESITGNDAIPYLN
jgi:hypothetical protein